MSGLSEWACLRPTGSDALKRPLTQTVIGSLTLGVSPSAGESGCLYLLG
jgi:hypothetical protein